MAKLKTLISLLVLSMIILVPGCSRSYDISGLYRDEDDQKSGLLIEPNGRGYDVTVVTLAGDRIRERLMHQYIVRSRQNYYRISTDTEGINCYEVKASGSSLVGICRSMEGQALHRAVLRRIETNTLAPSPSANAPHL